MIRRPPRSTRTDTLFPYTTLFRSRTKTHVAVACWEWGAYFGDATKGIRLDTAPWRRPAPYTARTQAKASGLYMIATMSKHHAAARGFDYALMFDWPWQVAEPSGSSAFLIPAAKTYPPQTHLCPHGTHTPHFIHSATLPCK